jgi:superfamily II DNA or RNA helicase
MTPASRLGLHLHLCSSGRSMRFVVWFERETDPDTFLTYKIIKPQTPIAHPYALTHKERPAWLPKTFRPVKCLVHVARLGTYFPIALPGLVAAWDTEKFKSKGRTPGTSAYQVQAWEVPVELSLGPLRALLREWKHQYGSGFSSPNTDRALAFLDDLDHRIADAPFLPTLCPFDENNLAPSVTPTFDEKFSQTRPGWTLPLSVTDVQHIYSTLCTSRLFAGAHLDGFDSFDTCATSWRDEPSFARLAIFIIELFTGAASRAAATPNVRPASIYAAIESGEIATLHTDHGSCLHPRHAIFTERVAPRSHMLARLHPLDPPDVHGNAWDLELGVHDGDKAFLSVQKLTETERTTHRFVEDGGHIWDVPGSVVDRDWRVVVQSTDAREGELRALLAPELLVSGRMNIPDGDAQLLLRAQKVVGDSSAFSDWADSVHISARPRNFTAFVANPTSQGIARVRVRWELVGDDTEEPSLHTARFTPELEVAVGDATLLAIDAEKLLLSTNALFVTVQGRVVARDELEAALAVLHAREKVFKRLGDVKGISWSRVIELDDEWTSENAVSATESLFGRRWSDFLGRLQNGQGVPQRTPPKGFQGTLRPYQLRGLSWMAFVTEKGFGGCLADDMGLGKTVQVLALIAMRRAGQTASRGPDLVICPTAVVYNWARESKKFTPSLNVQVHQGLTRAREAEAFAAVVKEADIVITSYALLRRDQTLFESNPWGLVVLDEAQNLKNPDALQTRSAKNLAAESKLCLTGTPVENHLRDLWSIFDISLPGLLGGQTRFAKTFLAPIRDGEPKAMERLNRRVGPFLLRRTKNDPGLVDDLPPKQEQDAWCELTAEQIALYQAMTEATLTGIVGKDGVSRRAHILTALMRFKQICNHPECFQKDKPTKVFNRSGKLERTMEILAELFDEKQRVVIFTQFREMGDILQHAIAERFEADVDFYHGGLNPKERDEMIQAFGEPDGPPALIVSLKAGGVGLNLTMASAVIHYDRWWNPAVEDQATDRTHRIGQKRMVNVYKFVTRHTLEERIVNLLESKRDLASKVLAASDDAWLTEMDDRALRDFLTLGQLSEDA